VVVPDQVPLGVEGWSVQFQESDVACPDGKAAPQLWVHPNEEEVNSVALILHSGAVDHLSAPDSEDPTFGTHASGQNRLSSDWALRRISATAGMSPNDDPSEVHQGTLVRALADAEVASLLPGNCWGDRWHNDADHPNDVEADAFERVGRLQAFQAWDSFDTTDRYLIGLGDGGNGAAELLHAGATPSAILIDSSPDDLATYEEQPELYAGVLAGLARTHPTGDYTTSSIVGVSDPILYAYAPLDESLPADIHAAALDSLSGGSVILPVDTTGHVLTNGDADLARGAVELLLGM